MGEFATDIYVLAEAYNALQKIQFTGLVTARTAAMDDLIYLQTQILDELQAWAVLRRGGVGQIEAKKS